MNKHMPILAALAAIFLLLTGCPKQDSTKGPPQALLDEVASARAAYDACAAYSPTDQDSAAYKAALNEAVSAMESGRYGEAMKKAVWARLEAERLHGKLVYRELEKTNPPQYLTYYYREQMTVSDQAAKAGDLDQAIASAQEARRQAELALEFQRQCFADGKESLLRFKNEIEQIYRADLEIIRTYWAALAAVDAQDCEKTRALLQKLETMIETEKRTRVYSQKTFRVEASDDYVRKYGYPAQYQEVTSQGLSGEVNRIHPHNEVTFIRSMLYSPTKTFYYVEDHATGTRGWMAEERLWPERAAAMKR